MSDIRKIAVLTSGGDAPGLFVERVRIAEFRLFLEQFEVTQRFEQNHFLVDYVGLAQHYGLKTDVLDVTNNIDVAMFFAMCD